MLVVGLAVAQPSMGIAQTERENNEARRLFNEGDKLHRDGNYIEAEKKFREALRRYPKADQADRTAFYLIDTLMKLGRVQESRAEAENFRRNYPKSNWKPDVNEKILVLGGLPGAPTVIWNSPAEVREAQARADLLRGARAADGPNKNYPDEFPPNASMKAEMLRMGIQSHPDQGIQDAMELLKANPADPVISANLGTIANSDSSRAVPFLLSVWVNTYSPPTMRNNAFFWFSRRNPNKEEVAKAIMDLFSKKETEEIGREALYRMYVTDHRAVLDKIVNSSNPDKFLLMDKIFRTGSELLRTDLLMFVALLTNDSRAVPFIVQAASRPDTQDSVRRAAGQALRNRKDVDPATVENLMRSTPSPRPLQPTRFGPTSVPPLPSGVPAGSALPILP
jgi:tetratricopeptide (TPR) repeat protein